MSQLSYSESCLARIQHLSQHEKDQVQDFRNYVSSGSEGTSRSAPDSPVIGLIESPAAGFPSADTFEKPSKPSPETSDTPAAAEGPKLVDLGVVEQKGQKVLPFDWYHSSLCLCQPKIELGKELFDDPLLSLDNMKKLADCMQWSFKFTKVSLLPLFVFVE